MGIRNSELRYIPVINPPDNPYLHIENMLKGEYCYVPKLDGMTFQSGIVEQTKKGPLFHQLSQKVEIPLLPPLETIPPDPIDTEELLQKRISSHLEEIIYSIEGNADANAFVLSHGRGYALRPEEIIVEKVSETTIAKFNNEVIKVGGRNRIQAHAVLFHRPR